MRYAEDALACVALTSDSRGHGAVTTWRERGAATFLLPGEIRRKLFPDRESMTMPESVRALSEPAEFARELVTAGFRDPWIEPVTHDHMLDLAALAEPESLFGMSPDWTSLDAAEKDAVITEARQMAGESEFLPIPSTELIAVAER